MQKDEKKLEIPAVYRQCGVPAKRKRGRPSAKGDRKSLDGDEESEHEMESKVQCVVRNYALYNF